ncbi:phytochromobilin:ferredoxin oxidoreductase, chloroplastic [Momordica charantia]|uniref:Phytochromobilin:ferredoxin oxidoreductase, chloroplastic n=1 Tax=Momordica charantia TaxID=3673 RepID=A0A6J1DJE9_MOMCH|nr:phytochromobilin:ferredoxin oxidoreductase, chloroplastic [Momordica charantia]
MDSCSRLSFCSPFNSPPFSSNCSGKNKCRRASFVPVSAISYQKFVQFALDETKLHTHLCPTPLQEKYNSMISMDKKAKLQMLSFQAPKIRLLRSLNIESEAMQVLDFAVFPKPEFDVPIFCANIFSAASSSIVVLDLNPLHDVISQRDYKEKYYESLLHLGTKYAELLPWGGKLTSESLKFFSPIVIWTKFPSTRSKYDILFSAFVDYYKAWLELMNNAREETNPSRLMVNREAQHRYLSWRVEKDPGHGLLKRLIGEALAKDLLRNFLFNGVDELGSKRFLEYFPEYCCEDGTINKKRSMVGKSYEHRPWDKRGEFVGDLIKT